MLVKTQPDVESAAVKRRAWLSMTGLGMLAGCRERVESGGSPEDPWIPLMDSWEGVMGGETALTDGGALRLSWGEALTGAKWTGEIPSPPFEIKLEARRMDGTDFFCGLTFPARPPGECVTLIVGGWGGGVVGISSIDGFDASENKTTVQRMFEKERWYRIRLRRSGERIGVWLNDEQVIDVDTAGRRLSLRPGPVEVCAPFGLATWQSTGEIRAIRWRPLRD